MARSIFRRLHRRYGTQVGLDRRLRAARPGIDRLIGPGGATPAPEALPPSPAAPPSPGAPPAAPAESPVDRVAAALDRLAAERPFQGRTVAVIGGGFAGLSAAYAAFLGGGYVTLYEATPFVGGRVQSDAGGICAGRIVERGAELIGTIHPVWLALARRFGLGMVSIDDETALDAVGIDPDYVFDGVPVPGDRLEDLFADFDTIQAVIWETARRVDSNAPWTTLPELDPVPFSTWLDAQLQGVTLRYPGSLDLFLAELENDNVAPAAAQSTLAVLAQIAAGGEVDGRPLFFTDVELFRCDRGNHALADCLLTALRDGGQEIMTGMPIGKIVVPTTTGARVDLYGYVDYVFGNPYWGVPNPHDYVVFAAPTVLNGENGVTAFLDDGDGPMPFAMPATSAGNAVKLHLRRSTRFWLPPLREPNGTYFLADDRVPVPTGIGQMWEATSNQAQLAPDVAPPVVLSVFTGSRGAAAAIAHSGDIAAFYTPLLDALQPGWADGGSVSYSQINAISAAPNVAGGLFPGYSCPAPGEVTAAMKALNGLVAGKLAYAGEQASPGFYGYMEGALASGLNAVLRLGGLSAGLTVAAETASAAPA